MVEPVRFRWELLPLQSLRPRRGGGAEGPAEPPAPGERRVRPVRDTAGNGRGVVGLSGRLVVLGVGPAVGSGPGAGTGARRPPRL